MKKKSFQNFLNFFQNFVIFPSNADFFICIFEMSIFWPESGRLPKNCRRICQMPKMFTKKILITFQYELTKKIPNLDPLTGMLTFINKEFLKK